VIWTISWRSLMIAIARESQHSLDAVAWWCVKFILHRIFHMTPIKSKNEREDIIYNSCSNTIEISDMRYRTNGWLHAYLGHICISIMRKVWVKTYGQIWCWIQHMSDGVHRLMKALVKPGVSTWNVGTSGERSWRVNNDRTHCSEWRKHVEVEIFSSCNFQEQIACLLFIGRHQHINV